MLLQLFALLVQRRTRTLALTRRRALYPPRDLLMTSYPSLSRLSPTVPPLPLSPCHLCPPFSLHYSVYITTAATVLIIAATFAYGCMPSKDEEGGVDQPLMVRFTWRRNKRASPRPRLPALPHSPLAYPIHHPIPFPGTPVALDPAAVFFFL